MLTVYKIYVLFYIHIFYNNLIDTILGLSVVFFYNITYCFVFLLDALLQLFPNYHIADNLEIAAKVKMISLSLSACVILFVVLSAFRWQENCW